MLITINGTKLCEVSQLQLAEVVQLLGKDSFMFTMDQAQQTLNLMLPFQCYQVVLETDDKSIAELLTGTVKLLAQARYNSVQIVRNDAESKRVHQTLDMTCPITWITISTDSDESVWRVHYSLNQMKQSKALALQLVQELEPIHPTRMQGLQLKWKQVMNSIRAASDKTITAIRLDCRHIHALSEIQLDQIQFALANAVIASHTNKPVLQLIQALLTLEQASIIPHEEPTLTEASSLKQSVPQETILISKSVKKKFGLRAQQSQSEYVNRRDTTRETDKQQSQEQAPRSPVELQTMHPAREEDGNEQTVVPTVTMDQVAKQALLSREQQVIEQEVEQVASSNTKHEQTKSERRVEKGQSTFRLLQAHSRHIDAQPNQHTPEGSSSFMSYMNQKNLAQSSDLRRAEQQKFNILTEHRKARK